MKYLSLFSGIGGFELGIKAKCVGYSEIDKYAIQIYQKHFPKHRNHGNATTIDATKLPDFDLLVGGFPCQSFSIAGKRGGFNDTRGTLFFDIARILKEKRPRNFILENVKGLLSHDNGQTFKTIITTLTELGYCVEWQVLNSKNFGVPQNRERVFIIGYFGEQPSRKVFPIREPDEIYTRPSEVKEEIHAGTLTARQFASWNGNYIKQLNNPTHSNNRIYGTDGLSPTINTMQGGNRQPFIQTDIRIRKLTPLECERLQGFPDNWTEIVSDSQRYKCLGNAVTVNVIKYLMELLISNK